MLLRVKHNIEVAHRLYLTKGKCEAIHGHSMLVTLSIEGTRGDNGMAQYYSDEGMKDLEFGAIKKAFRSHLDETYDHRLLLNAADPFSGPIWQMKSDGTVDMTPEGNMQKFLPGLLSTMGDPTTENIAKWIHDWALAVARLPVSHVEVWETSVNCAVYP